MRLRLLRHLFYSLAEIRQVNMLGAYSQPANKQSVLQQSPWGPRLHCASAVADRPPGVVKVIHASQLNVAPLAGSRQLLCVSGSDSTATRAKYLEAQSLDAAILRRRGSKVSLKCFGYP
jgi:hypothetical protein